MEVKDRRRERSAVVSVHRRSSNVGVAKASGCHGREVSDLGQRQFRGVGVLEAPSYRELMREGERGWGGEWGLHRDSWEGCEAKGGLSLSWISWECLLDFLPLCSSS